MPKKLSPEARARKRKRKLTELGKGKCLTCKKEFQRFRWWQTYCSSHCRYVAFQRKGQIKKEKANEH